MVNSMEKIELIWTHWEQQIYGKREREKNGERQASSGCGTDSGNVPSTASTLIVFDRLACVRVCRWLHSVIDQKVFASK